jgi:Tol biopolymer transport system component
MNNMRDPNLIIGSWLDEGPTELPETTRRAITTSVRTLDQRRGIALPWGRSVGSSAQPLLVAAAVIVAVAGIYLVSPFGRSPGIGPPVGSPSTSAPSSPVTAPGPGGRIAFTRYDAEIGPLGPNAGTFTVNADGSGERQLQMPFTSDGLVWSPDGMRLLLQGIERDGQRARPAVADADGSSVEVLEVDGAFDLRCGAWSPDGQRLLCSVADQDDPSSDGIYTMAADGTDLQRLTVDAFPGVRGSVSECAGQDVPGDFSPDGTQFVFVRVMCGGGEDPAAGQTAEIHVGTIGEEATIAITIPGFVHSLLPSAHWSPDGQWIVFGGSSHLLYMVRPDGTGRQTIQVPAPSLDAFLYRPDWSPDGSRIVFSMHVPDADGSELYSTAADGSDLRRITSAPLVEDYASWGPPAP